jgi:hypothetical protein
MYTNSLSEKSAQQVTLEKYVLKNYTYLVNLNFINIVTLYL